MTADRGPDGIVCSDAFVDYLEEFRERFPADPELAQKHGVAAGNGHSDTEPMTESTDETAQIENMNMSRRRFMATTGATAAAIAAGAGPAAAQESDAPNFESDLIQSPRIESTVTVASHTSEMSSPLEYINNNGEAVSLADDGANVAERADPDTPHNPVTLRADKFVTYEYREFPRGEQFDEDGDGDAETDLNAVDAQHWTKDVSGSAGSLTVETVTAPNGENALRVAASGQGSGDVALATFTDVEITSGVERKYIQLVNNVNSLASGASVYVRVRDSTGSTVETWIDSSADETALGTIATATGSGQVYQAQIGEFSTSLEDIVEIEIAVENGDADLVLPAINLDRESRWSFGTREYTNSDDELDSETVYEPTGEFSIVGLDSLPDTFANSGIKDVQVEAEFRTEDLSTDMREFRWRDAERYSFENRLETLVGFELPTAYDLSYSSSTLRDTVLFPDGRYTAAEYATDQTEIPAWDDVDDVSWTDESSTYENASVDDDVTLASSVSAGSLLVVHHEYLLSDDERGAATASGGGAGGGPTGSSSGWFGVRGLVMSMIAGVVGYFGFVRKYVGA